MKKRVFLLGAGFSEIAGMPLTKDWIGFMRNHLKTSRNVIDIEFNIEFTDFINKFQPIYPWLFDDVELFFTYLDLLSINDRSIFGDYFTSVSDMKKFRRKLSGTLVGAFDEAHRIYYEAKSIKLKEAQKIYNEFCNGFGCNDTIISFNYDLIVERQLWIEGKWTFLDGYGFNKDIKDFEIGWKEKYPSTKPKSSILKIYKLHGSLGWGKGDGDDQFLAVEIKNHFPGYYGTFCEGGDMTVLANYDRGTTFIEPSYLKTYDHPAILDIWYNASKSINESEELIIIGYRLPSADSAARLFLSTATRSSNISSITIVNPSDVSRNFEDVLGKKVNMNRMTFAEWAKNVNN